MASSYDPTKDPYAGLAPSITAPGRMLRQVTPSDAEDLAVYATSLWAYSPDDGGTVRLTPVGAADDADHVTITLGLGLQPLPPCQVRRVWATGTSAGVLVYALSHQ